MVVLRNPFFASVEEDGRFSVTLPPGRRRLLLWRPREREVTLDVEAKVEDGTPIEWVPPQRRP
ncbi:MAG TPA: hypothetical protein VEP66_03610 [Myxococcales bacterium]|nr:hypothetical protein [Myxococcales bacterium]